MSTLPYAPVSSTFFTPLSQSFGKIKHQRDCPTLPDRLWLDLVVRRSLEQDDSFRGLIQRFEDSVDRDFWHTTIFESLKSERRLKFIESANLAIMNVCNEQVYDSDPFQDIHSLAGFDLYCGDGHYLEHCTHDDSIDGSKRPVGQFFGLNMRSHALFLLDTSDLSGSRMRKREHDMHMMKRLGAESLRRGAPAGRKVLWVWDRAGINAQFWIQCKQRGVYFLSLAKDNMLMEHRGDFPYDASNPINAGVETYGLVYVGGQALRYVQYTCPESGESYSFITTLTTVEPGVIAALYRARWDIEKVFDETKQKLEVKKSWAKSMNARRIQAHAVAITHNLMLLMTDYIRVVHDVDDHNDAKRRRKRCIHARLAARQRSQRLSPIVVALFRRATQRSMVFIRWLRNNFDRPKPLAWAIGRLRSAYERRIV